MLTPFHLFVIASKLWMAWMGFTNIFKRPDGGDIGHTAPHVVPDPVDRQIQ